MYTPIKVTSILSYTIYMNYIFFYMLYPYKKVQDSSNIKTHSFLTAELKMNAFISFSLVVQEALENFFHFSEDLFVDFVRN